MANYYTESPIIDPDELGYLTTTNLATSFAGATDELIIDYTNKLIGLKVAGNLDNDGAAIKAVYSKLKDAWRADATLIKFPFPMSPITDEQFEMVNGWNWDKTQTSGTDSISATTVQLLRTGGWQVVNTAGSTTEEWAGIISLGDLGVTDQVYYDQSNDETADNTANFILKGKVNQAIQIYSDPNGDGSTADGFNYRGYFKMFVREWQKVYAASAFSDVGVTTATFQAYRFPLTNATDLKVTHAELLVAGTGLTASAASDGTVHTYTVASGHGVVVGEAITVSGFTGDTDFNVTGETVTAVGATTISVTPTTAAANLSSDTGGTLTMPVYSNISISYARDAADGRVVNADVKGLWVSGTTYAVGDVVESPADGEWYIATTGTSGTTDPSLSADWAAYAFDREISVGSTNFYAFTVVVDGDTTTATYNGGAATTAQIYEYVQYQLRQAADIDAANPGTVIGKTANALLTFVGDTLVTSNGVYVDSFKETEINSIDFYDYSGTVRRFDFTAFLIINFGQNLQDDEFSKYWVFFTNDDDGDNSGNDFGTANAIIVDDAAGVDMAGDVNNTLPSPYVPRTFVSHSYNYDGNVQRGSASAGKDAPVTVVAIGLDKGQYVQATGTITRSKTNTVSLIASLERNYAQGATFP
jgi:hypothetical protein